jgi:hypothetical protein
MPSEVLDGTGEFFEGPSGSVKAVMKCNNTQVSAKPLEFIRSILELGYRLQAIINTLKEAPKLGWYAEMSVQLAQGTLALTWGWQECENKEAFLQAGVEVRLKLFDIKAEVGIGIDVLAGKIQAFALIQGTLSVKVNPVQRTGPGMNGKVSGGVGSTLKGEIGTRGKVPGLAQVEAVGETAIKLKNTEVGFDTGEDEGGGFYMEGKIRWTGFKVRAMVSKGADTRGGGGGKESENSSESKSGDGQTQRTMIEGKDLASWYWPPSRKHVSDRLHPDEVRRILTKVFYGGDPDSSGVGRVTSVIRQKAWPLDNVEVRERGKRRTEMPPEEVAEYTAETIMKRPDVRRDREAIVKMAEDIREGLDEYSDTLTRRVLKTDFMAFLHHGELDEILDDYTY